MCVHALKRFGSLAPFRIGDIGGAGANHPFTARGRGDGFPGYGLAGEIHESGRCLDENMRKALSSEHEGLLESRFLLCPLASDT